MKIVTLDYETYYDADYSLKKLSTSAYITDPRFKCLGVAVKVDDKPAQWIPEHRLLAWHAAAQGFLEQNMVLAHHAQFDGLILHYHYGIKPKAWLDTLAMAKGLGLSVTVGGSLLALARHFGLGEKPDLRPDSTLAEVEFRGTWDADATYKLFRLLSPGFPKDEYKLIDLTVREFTEPVIEVDVPMLTQMADELDDAKAAALQRLAEQGLIDGNTLGSPALFCSALEALGVDVEWKKTPAGNTIPAIAKTDDFMISLLESEDATVQALAAARLGNKSTGDGTRARTYAAMAQNGPLPVYYNYYGAHTGRWSGGDATNFANLKRGGVLRNAICAPEGCTFVVGDLAQIEARITALLAGQDDLVEAFAQKRSAYCEFASYAFRRPVTKADEFEYFTGKFWVLGGGFGMGAAKGYLQTKAEINKRKLKFTPPTREQCRAFVDSYRAMYPQIPKLWKRMEWLLAEPGREIGPLTSEHEAILLPNGMRLRYPELKWEAYKDKQGEDKIGFRYNSRRGRIGTWGGALTENCVGQGTEVLTDNGWLPIEQVTLAHRIWDGVEWVNHSGVVNKGAQQVWNVGGVYMTPEHQVLTSQGWKRGETCNGLDRQEVRLPVGFGTGEASDKRQPNTVASTLRLRHGNVRQNFRCQADAYLPSLRSSQRPRHAWYDEAPRVRGMAFNARSVPFVYSPILAQLWRAWDQSVQAMGKVRDFLARHGANLCSGVRVGSPEQSRWIQQKELSVGTAKSKCPQQANESVDRHSLGTHDGGGSCGTQWDEGYDAALSSRARGSGRIVVLPTRLSKQVYDLLNCGPRQRFVVRGSAGILIVHNCAQALARIIMAGAMLDLRSHGFLIPLHTYDEIVLCVPDESVENAKTAMQRAMTKPPEWMPDLPLAVEIGTGKRYGEAK